MLFYFTGTGNSLYVARQIEETPISIPQVLHQENLNFKDEKIGIVYPVYAGEAPKIVLEFLEKATFETDYFYLILTYGKDVTDAPECIARLLEEKGRVLCNRKVNFLRGGEKAELLPIKGEANRRAVR